MSELPIRSILGVQNPSNPFEVLGLPVGLITEADVIDALGGRMQAVAAHRLSETPEGNEVRLALHAAAAQLLDARIRAALLERAGVTGPASPPSTPPRPAEASLGPQALMVIASEGGWNQRAMRRLALLAHAEGVSSSAVPMVVRQLAGEHRPEKRSDDEQERRGRVPSKQQRASTSRENGSQTLPTLLTACAASLALGLTWAILSSGLDREQAAAEASPAAEAVAPQTPTDADPGQPLDVVDAVENDEPMAALPPAELDAPDWASALVGIRDSGDPADAATLDRILAGIALSWFERDQTDLRRITTAFIDVVYQMPAKDAASVVDAMADQIRSRGPAAASLHAGLLTRLSIERSLPTALDNAIVAATVSTIGGSQRTSEGVLERGLSLGLVYSASRWPEASPSADTLNEWMACADAVELMSPALESRVVRQTLEALLRSERDPLADAALLQTVEALALRLEPSSDPEAAGLLLRLLADPGVPTRGLSVVVNAIGRGVAAGFDSDGLRLVPTASSAERADVRSRLAGLWLQGSDSGSERTELQAALQRHLDADAPATPGGRLADTVVSARLSNACRLLQWGAPEQASVIVGALRNDVDRILAQRSATSAARSNAAEAWAIKYLEARRNIPVRLALLGELVRNRTTLGAIAAELVVAEAVNGSPVRVRREAQDVVLIAADQPSIVNAALEVLPTAPRVRSVQEIMERVAARPLPPIDDPTWMVRTRRALVDRVLEIEGGSREGRVIDDLAVLLAEEHRQMLASEPSSGNPIEDSMQRLVQERVDEIRRIDLSGLATSDVDEILRLHAGRLAIAEGAVTRYAAYQVTAVELLAQIISLESPHLRDRAKQRVARLTDDRLNAVEAFEQISLTERAGLELWMLRLEIEP